jgi:hypothetical protein
MPLKNILLICLFSILCFSFLFPVSCLATDAKTKFELGLKNTGQAIGYTQTDVNEASQSLPQRIGKVIQIILTFLGVIFLALMIYAGYVWMMAKGNEQLLTKAKNTIITAITGLIVVLAAYALTAIIGTWMQGKY